MGTTEKKRTLVSTYLLDKPTVNSLRHLDIIQQPCPEMLRTCKQAIYMFICYQIPFSPSVHTNLGLLTSPGRILM